MKVMAIMSYVSVEIVVTDLENIQDQLQHVQVGTEYRKFGPGPSSSLSSIYLWASKSPRWE